MIRNTSLLPCLLLLLGLCAHSPAEDPVTLSFDEPTEVDPRIHSFNSNLLMATALRGITYGGPEFNKAIRELRPGGLRFPGGTTANNYLWQEDSFSLQKDDKTKWAAQQLELFRKIGKRYDLPGYARLCQEHGLQPIWVLNVYEETPESVVKLFDHLATLGLDVKAVEMGNEPYWDPRSLMNFWKYNEFCRPLAEAIRKHHPQIKIGACFGPLTPGSNYKEKWNQPLAQQKWYDAAIYHEYYGGQGFALEKGSTLPVNAVLHPEKYIDEPVEYFNELLPGKPIWFTEWNIGAEGLKQWKNTGAELLFISAAVSRVFKHRETIKWSCFHQIYESNFGTFYFDKATGIQTLPSYELYRMIGAAFGGAESIQTLNQKNKAIVGFATRGNQDARVFIANRSNKSVAITLPDTLHPIESRLTILVDPTEKLPMSESIAKKQAVTGKLTELPAYSMSLLGSESTIDSAMRRDLKESNIMFPVRPHLTLWYPPYAKNQPRVDAQGRYAVDFNTFADKATAMVKMNLKGLDLKAGDQYAVSFEAKSTPAIGFTAKLPADNADGKWIQMTPRQEPQRIEFTYSPEANKGELSFIFTKAAIAKAGQVSFEKFKLVRLGK